MSEHAATFLDSIERLMQQQSAFESRRDSESRQQLEKLEQIQCELARLAEQVSSPWSGVPSPADSTEPSAQSTTSPPAPAETPESPLSDWERQKQRLLAELCEGTEGGASHNRSSAANVERPRAAETSTEPPTRSLRSPPAAAPARTGAPAPAPAPAPAHSPPLATASPQDHQQWADWLDHLDPQDPALDDAEVRKMLVARLRKIEVELSLERAQLARDRSELELRTIELERLQAAAHRRESRSSRGKSGWVRRMMRKDDS